MTVLLACFGVALASAFMPFIPIEAYLGAAVSESSQTWWALAIAATLGQMLGKIAIFLLGRQSMQWAWLQRRMERHNADKYVVRLTEAAERRPVAVDGVVFVSASVGIPPFAVVSLLAGQLNMSLPRFLAIGLVGRFVRFGAVALGVDQVLHLL